jgi:hypothetical protein
LPEKPDDGPSFLFPNSKGTPVCLFGKAKVQIDEACLAVMQEIAVEEGGRKR